MGQQHLLYRHQRAFRITGETAYLDRALDWANANQWLAGPESGGAAAADSQLCGQTYVDLYRLDPQPIRIADIDSEIHALVNNPAADDDWWWIDAFYMAGSTFVKLGNEAGDTDYFEQMSLVAAKFADRLEPIEFLTTAGATEGEWVGTNFERKYLKEKRQEHLENFGEVMSRVEDAENININVVMYE